jgi:hypothetical protein
MSAERSGYVPLLALAVDWAAAAGMPKELVLRRLCHWAMAGAFPEGAFITVTGAEISPFDIYLSFRAATEETGLLGSGGIYLDGYTFCNNNDRWGMHVLAKVIITAPNVFVFCKHTKTLAPPSLLSGFSRLLAGWDRAKHVAPPECPDADEIAAKHHARDHAIGLINSLRSTLSGLQGKPTTRLGASRVPDELIDFEYWGAKWKRTLGDAQEAIARCHDPSLQRELDSVDAEWNAFVEQESATVAAPNVCQSQESAIVRQVDIPKQSKRRGRPSGSGSYEASDALIVEQMRETLIKEPNLSPTAAAIRFANDAVGGGTPESKAKRLTERYSAKYGNHSG